MIRLFTGFAASLLCLGLLCLPQTTHASSAQCRYQNKTYKKGDLSCKNGRYQRCKKDGKWKRLSVYCGCKWKSGSRNARYAHGTSTCHKGKGQHKCDKGTWRRTGNCRCSEGGKTYNHKKRVCRRSALYECVQGNWERRSPKCICRSKGKIYFEGKKLCRSGSKGKGVYKCQKGSWKKLGKCSCRWQNESKVYKHNKKRWKCKRGPGVGLSAGGKAKCSCTVCKNGKWVHKKWGFCSSYYR